jgi:hypothetical protein
VVDRGACGVLHCPRPSGQALGISAMTMRSTGVQ